MIAQQNTYWKGEKRNCSTTCLQSARFARGANVVLSIFLRGHVTLQHLNILLVSQLLRCVMRCLLSFLGSFVCNNYCIFFAAFPSTLFHCHQHARSRVKLYFSVSAVPIVASLPFSGRTGTYLHATWKITFPKAHNTREADLETPKSTVLDERGAQQ